jgi:phage tail sheath protein FI
MAVNVTYPGVYIQELPSAVHPITGVATSIGAFVGYTARGIDNRAEQIFSFSDYERLFGGLASDSELSYAVQQFFANGGNEAYVVRAPRTGAKGAQVVFGGLTFTALSSGTWANGELLIDVDYSGLAQGLAGTVALTKTNATVTGTGTFFTTALKINQWLVFGADLTQTPYQIKTITSDTILTLTAGYGGSTTASTTAMVIVDPLACNLTITDLVDGTVETFPKVSLNSSQKNYVTNVVNDPDNGSQLVNVQVAGSPTTAPTVTGVVGTPLTISAVNTALAGGATNTTATKDYGVQMSVSSPAAAPAPLPITIKVFAINTLIPQSVSGVASQLQRALNAALAVQMPGASVQCSVFGSGSNQGIRVSALLPQMPDAVVTFKAPPTGPSDASLALGLNPSGNTNVAHYALGTNNGTAVNGWGGQQTSSAQGSDGSGLPGTSDLIGDPGAFTGIYALQKVDLFNLLSIPDATRATPGNPSVLDTSVDPNSIYSAAIALCDGKRAFLLIDCPPYVNTVPSAVDWITSGLTVSDANGAAFFPRLRLPDPLNNFQLRTFAPSGVVAGLYARIDSTRGVWKAPAGTEATLSGVQALVYKLSDAENGALNPLGLNCFRTFPVYKSVLWGARTLLGADAETSQWKYVPVRRVALFMEESLYRGTQWVVFEPNDEPLWSAIRLNVGSFMQNLFIQGFFQGQTPAEAYFVKCDSETTTQTDIDLGIVNIVVGFAPLKPAEFVVIQIQQMAGQITS